ncbi:PQQ-binding-like beta-propeller repeat protein [Streptomyces gamaensis]|uniref:PQQ-binding-like beta-propeller repeat protein n=1 Tax=Streptomyces gamaensis TaxID=1763542 RepID=A0ABW0Z1K1_9ACTN
MNDAVPHDDSRPQAPDDLTGPEAHPADRATRPSGTVPASVGATVPVPGPQPESGPHPGPWPQPGSWQQPGRPPHQSPAYPGYGPEPRKKLPRRTLVGIVGTAVLVFGTAVGTGTWLLWPVIGDGAGRRADKGTWSVPHTPAGDGPSKMIRGLWVTDKAVVKALPDGVHAYDPGNGKELWTTPHPAGATLCQASTDSTGDIAVLAVRRDGDKCSTFTAVDLNSGKTLWEHALDTQKHFSDAGDAIARTGDTVVLSAIGHTTEALRVSDGTRLWKETDKLLASKGCDKEYVSKGYTGGHRLVRLQSCWTADFKTVNELVGVDPATGRAQWSHKLGKEGGWAKVMATSPVVVNDPATGDDRRMRLTVLDDNGTVRTRLAEGAETDRGLLTADGSPSANVQIKGDKIFVVAAGQKTDEDDHNKMVAWSLTTGQRLWERKSTGYLQSYRAVTSDTDDVLAYVAGNVHDPSRLVRFDPDSGDTTLVRRYRSAARAHAWIGSDPYVLLHHGRLYLSAGFVGERRDGDSADRQKSLIALPAT